MSSTISRQPETLRHGPGLPMAPRTLASFLIAVNSVSTLAALSHAALTLHQPDRVLPLDAIAALLRAIPTSQTGS
jgi:hypothetical protein